MTKKIISSFQIFILMFGLSLSGFGSFSEVHAGPKKTNSDIHKKCGTLLAVAAVSAAIFILHQKGVVTTKQVSSVAWSVVWSSAYGVLRARSGDDLLRLITFIAGFPSSLIPWALVKEGSGKFFGFNVGKDED